MIEIYNDIMETQRRTHCKIIGQRFAKWVTIDIPELNLKEHIYYEYTFHNILLKIWHLFSCVCVYIKKLGNYIEK